MVRLGEARGVSIGSVVTGHSKKFRIAIMMS